MRKVNQSIIASLSILWQNEWKKNHAILIENGKIQKIMPDVEYKLKYEKYFNDQEYQAQNNIQFYEFSEQHYLVPGFIDLHIHGAAGYDVMDATPPALFAISSSLAAEGVTGFLATTMTASHQNITSALKNIAVAHKQLTGAALLGVHLEGPFISTTKMGAQNSENVITPSSKLIMDWQKAANNMIKLVTLAPELPQALDLITKLNGMGIIASVGHSNATYHETMLAINAGCSHATHLFNAMRGIHQREPGTAGALLLSDEVNAELIADGLHLHPAIIEMALRIKGKNNLLLVTDAMRAKCMGDGEYDLGGQVVSVRSQTATLKDGTLAGSTLRMPQAIKNIMQFTECSLADAIQMAAYNPARVLGLEQSKGVIDQGKDADLVVLDADHNVVMTFRAGEKIYNV